MGIEECSADEAASMVMADGQAKPSDPPHLIQITGPDCRHGIRLFGTLQEIRDRLTDMIGEVDAEIARQPRKELIVVEVMVPADTTTAQLSHIEDLIGSAVGGLPQVLSAAVTGEVPDGR